VIAPGAEFRVPEPGRLQGVGRHLRRVAAAAGRFLIGGLRGLAWMFWNPAVPLVTPRSPRLIECAYCGTDHVCPVETEVVDETRCWIRLRCGTCEVWRDVVVSNDEAARFERAVGQQAASIERAAARLDRERMAQELDAFLVALERDLIDASSFAR
jgi:hypothetical protein